MLDSFKERVVQRKGRLSIEALAAGKESTVSTSPSNRGKKRLREGGNTVRTTRSPRVVSTPPPPRCAPIDVDSSPTDDFNRPIPPLVDENTMKVSMSPLSMLGVTYSSQMGWLTIRKWGEDWSDRPDNFVCFYPRWMRGVRPRSTWWSNQPRLRETLSAFCLEWRPIMSMPQMANGHGDVMMYNSSGLR